MNNRIYNEYGAAIHPNIDGVDQQCTRLVEEIWKWGEENDICPRDLNSYVCNEINSLISVKNHAKSF